MIYCALLILLREFSHELLKTVAEDFKKRWILTILSIGLQGVALGLSNVNHLTMSRERCGVVTKDGAAGYFSRPAANIRFITQQTPLVISGNKLHRGDDEGGFANNVSTTCTLYLAAAKPHHYLSVTLVKADFCTQYDHLRIYDATRSALLIIGHIDIYDNDLSTSTAGRERVISRGQPQVIKLSYTWRPCPRDRGDHVGFTILVASLNVTTTEDHHRSTHASYLWYNAMPIWAKIVVGTLMLTSALAITGFCCFVVWKQIAPVCRQRFGVTSKRVRTDGVVSETERSTQPEVTSSVYDESLSRDDDDSMATSALGLPEIVRSTFSNS